MLLRYTQFVVYACLITQCVVINLYGCTGGTTTTTQNVSNTTGSQKGKQIQGASVASNGVSSGPPTASSRKQQLGGGDKSKTIISEKRISDASSISHNNHRRRSANEKVPRTSGSINSRGDPSADVDDKKKKKKKKGNQLMASPVRVPELDTGGQQTQAGGLTVPLAPSGSRGEDAVGNSGAVPVGIPSHVETLPPPAALPTPPPHVATPIPTPSPPQPPPPPENALPLEVRPPVTMARCQSSGAFYERYCVEGEGDIPRYIIGAPPVTDEERSTIVANAVGEWVNAKISNAPNAHEFDEVLVRSLVAAELANVDYKRFWIASKGPEFLQTLTNMNANGEEGSCGHSGNPRDITILSRLNCFTFMMLITNIPVPNNMKRRHVARDLGLNIFCVNFEVGLGVELDNHIDDYDFSNLHYFDQPDEKQKQGIRKGFAANWLAFCPNLISLSSKENRKKVFNHAKYRHHVRVSSSADRGFHILVMNRDDTLTEFIPTLLAPNAPATLLSRVVSARFALEDGVGPGVITNWYEEMGKQIFGNTFGIFEYSDNNKYVHFKEDLLAADAGDAAGNVNAVKDKLKAAGRFVGHAIFNGRNLAADLTTMFVARISGHMIGFEALAAYELNFYGILTNIHERGRDYSPEVLPCLADRGYEEWPLDQAERDRLLDIYVSDCKSVGSPNMMESGYNDFVSGIFEVMPQSIFESGITVLELHEVIFGVATVDVEDMFAHWVLQGYALERNRQIIWLEEILREWSRDEVNGQRKLRRFVDFVTGSSRVLAGGFARYQPEKGFPFTILRSSNRIDSLPKSHNCWNRIDLPPYSTKEKMEEQIFEAIMGANGFGIL